MGWWLQGDFVRRSRETHLRRSSSCVRQAGSYPEDRIASQIVAVLERFVTAEFHNEYEARATVWKVSRRHGDGVVGKDLHVMRDWHRMCTGGLSQRQLAIRTDRWRGALGGAPLPVVDNRS